MILLTMMIKQPPMMNYSVLFIHCKVLQLLSFVFILNGCAPQIVGVYEHMPRHINSASSWLTLQINADSTFVYAVESSHQQCWSTGVWNKWNQDSHSCSIWLRSNVLSTSGIPLEVTETRKDCATTTNLCIFPNFDTVDKRWIDTYLLVNGTQKYLIECDTIVVPIPIYSLSILFTFREWGRISPFPNHQLLSSKTYAIETQSSNAITISFPKMENGDGRKNTYFDMFYYTTINNVFCIKRNKAILFTNSGNILFKKTR